jgi:hypothetical protein
MMGFAPVTFCCQGAGGRLSLGGMDTNYWGLWCVPLGLALCFGPALLAAAFFPIDKSEDERRGKYGK